eukprot:gene4237-4148_t
MSLLKTLKGQILVVSAACMVAALLVLTLVNYFSARAQARVALAEEGQATAKSHAEAIEEWTRAKAGIIAASIAAFEEPEPAKSLAMLRDAGKFSTAYFGYADKKYVFSEVRNLPADYDPTARPWYKQAAQAGTSVVTPPYISASDQKLVVTFATPVGAGSALKGVAAGDVYMESVVANVASIQPTPQSFAFLVSADGKIIAHKNQGLTLKPITELSKDLAIEPLLAAAKTKGLLPTDIAGRSRLLSVVPIAGTSWMLVVALDESEAMAPIRAMLATSLISSVLVLVVAVALLGVVLTRRLRQLTLVRDAMHEIGAGDGDLSRRIDAHGEDELAQIAGSFNSFAGKLSGVLAQIRDASSSVLKGPGIIGAHELLPLSSPVSPQVDSRGCGSERWAFNARKPDAMTQSMDVALQAFAPALPLAVALSGGADSTALLLACARRWPGRVLAIHIHHGLQAAADGFEQHCVALCHQLGVPLRVQRLDARPAPGQSPEDAAPIAQHADDQVETLLLALSRGAGVAGLAAMPAQWERGGLVWHRPLLQVAASDVRQWLKAQGQAWVEDPTNRDERYTRNRIRAQLLPVLETVFPSFRDTFARSAANAAQATELLQELAQQDLLQVGQPPKIKALQMLSRTRQANVLRHWLRHAHLTTPTAAQLSELLNQIGACSTRAHSIRIKVGSGFVVRSGTTLDWLKP